MPLFDKIPSDAVRLPQSVTIEPGLLWHSSDQLSIARRRYPLAGLTATVETVGEVSHERTMTRNVLALGKSKKVDTRQALLRFTSPTVNVVVPIKPDAWSQAQSFAASVNMSASRLAQSQPS